MKKDEQKGGSQDKPKSRFPEHWGEPPLRQTRDLRDLPGGYGKGSSTLAAWITENMKKDEVNKGGKPKSKYPEHWGEPPRMQTKDYR